MLRTLHGALSCPEPLRLPPYHLKTPARSRYDDSVGAERKGREIILVAAREPLRKGSIDRI